MPTSDTVIDEPPPRKPVTIDPGVDVGFGPGVAPPTISPQTGMPVEAEKPLPPTMEPTGAVTGAPTGAFPAAKPLTKDAAIAEPQKPKALTTDKAIAEPQKPKALTTDKTIAEPEKPKGVTKDTTIAEPAAPAMQPTGQVTGAPTGPFTPTDATTQVPAEDPYIHVHYGEGVSPEKPIVGGVSTAEQAGARQKQADLEREKQAEIAALGSPDTPEKLQAYEAKKKEIEDRYNAQITQAGIAPAQGIARAVDVMGGYGEAPAPGQQVGPVVNIMGGYTGPEPGMAVPQAPPKRYVLRKDPQGNIVQQEVWDPTETYTPPEAPGGHPTPEQIAMLPSGPVSVPGQVQGQPLTDLQQREQAAEQQRQAQEQQKYTPAPGVTAQDPQQATDQPNLPVTDPKYKFKYPLEQRAQMLINQFGRNADEIWRAYAKLSPELREQLRPVYTQAVDDVLQWNLQHPDQAAASAGLRGVMDTGRMIGGGIQGILTLPGTIPAALKAGVTAAQMLDIANTLRQGQPLSAQQSSIFRTFLASLEGGHHDTVQAARDLWNTYQQLQNLITGHKGTPDESSWAQVAHMSPQERQRFIQSKMESLAQRYDEDAQRARGAVGPWARGVAKQWTGADMPSLDDLRKKGIVPDPEALAGGRFAFSLGEQAPFFAIAEELGLGGVLSKVVGNGAGLSGSLLQDLATVSKGGEVKIPFTQKKIRIPGAEDIVPKLTRQVGEQAAKKVEKAVVTAVTGGHGAVIPSFMYPGGKWNIPVRAAGWLGERTGRLLTKGVREAVIEPMAKVLMDHSAEMANPGDPALAVHGPAGALMRVTSAAAKGGLYALPYTAGPKSPEEVGQILATGAALGAAPAVPDAAREAAMGSMFFRDPTQYKSMGFGPADYGTTHFGENFDAAHNTRVAQMAKWEQDTINDNRGMMPGIEQYHVGNQDFQGITQRAQANGWLPDGNLNSRAFNILKDPHTGQSLIIVNADAGGGLRVAAHEIGHTIYRTLTPDQRLAFKNAAFQVNHPDALTQWYFGNLRGRPIRYADLPDEAGIANGTQGYLPGLRGYTKEHFVEEMGAETVSALLRGKPLGSFIRDPSLFRRAQFALGGVMENLGIHMTPREATTILGVRPGVAQMKIMDKALRDYLKKNPVSARPSGGPPGGGGGGPGPKPGPRGRQTAATPQPQPQPAPRPPPPPPKGPAPEVTNNQPEIGGGATGAPQKEINDAVMALQSLKFPKKQAQQMVATAAGQTAAELLRNALKNHQIAQGRIEVPRAPQEAQAAQAPQMPHPLAAHRELGSPALVRRATAGDQKAVQALIERHGANWLQAVEKEDPGAVGEFRRKYPEQAAEQDQRVKAGVEAKPEGERVTPAVVGDVGKGLAESMRNMLWEKFQRGETTEAGGPSNILLAAAKEKAAGRLNTRADFDALIDRYGEWLKQRQAKPVKAEELSPQTPPHEAIAARAYELFEQRGGVHGHEQEDWAQAERELRQRAIDAAQERRVGFMPMAGEKALGYPDEDAGGRVFMSPIHGKKQFEIDDRDMTWTPAPPGAPERTMIDYNWGNSPDGSSKLGDIIQHHKLFENYPDLRNVRVEVRPEYRAAGSWEPRQPNDYGTMQPERIILKSFNRPVLAHEIQHAVQWRENWPLGSSPEKMVRELQDDQAVTDDLAAVFNSQNPELQPQDFPTQQAYFDHIMDRDDRWQQWYRNRIARMAMGAYKLTPGELEATAVKERAAMPPGWRVRPEESLAEVRRRTEEGVKQEFAQMLAPPRFMPDIREGAITPEEFIEQRNKSAHHGFLSPLAPEDLTSHRLFTSPDGKIGAALSPEGDIQNVYNNSEPKIRGGGTGALVHAIEQGGRTLDCYDGALPKIYRQAGFIETGRMRFNDQFAPPGWDYAKDDRPDVVFMGWGGYPEGGRESVLARATSPDKSANLTNEPSTRYYQPTEWDRAKEDSRAFARGAELPRVDGAERAAEAYAPGAGALPAPSEGIRRDTLTEREGPGPPEPQIPGSKVSFMPDIPEAPAAPGKPKKAKKAPLIKFPQELRDQRMSPEEKALLADMQEKARAGIDQFPDPGISGNQHASGQTAFPQDKMTKAQVAAFFDARNPRLDFSDPAHQQLMAQALTHDILNRLISDPESLGWYNRNVDWAMEELGKLDPRIIQDPVRNLMMRLAMAVTSQNQKVHPNFESAYRAYLHWDRTGLLPTDKAYFGGGTKSDAMIANFTKINDLITDPDIGYQKTEEIMRTPKSVKEIEELYDVKVPGEAKGYTSESSMMLGPKIGSFFNNLSKLYHTLTADLWFTRTMNRMAGRMMGFSKWALARIEQVAAEGAEGGEEEEGGGEPDIGASQLGKLRDLINQGKLENATKAKQRTMLKEIAAIEAFRDNPDALDRDQAMALLPTVRDWAAAQHKIYAKSTGYNEKGEYLQTYGQKTPNNLLSKNIDLNFQDLTDAPRNSTERENFRDIMRLVQSNLAGLGIDITHADAQAVLWYLEQDLFARAKGRKAGSNSADYLDAAYALRQKYSGKTPDEFGRVLEPEVEPSAKPTKEAAEKPAARARKAPGKAAAMPAGPEFPIPPRETRTIPLAPSVVSQAATAERKRMPPPLPSGMFAPRVPEVRRGQMMMPVVSAPPQTVQSGQQPPSQQQQGPSDWAVEPGVDTPAQGRNFIRGTPGRQVLNIILHSTDEGSVGSNINELTSGDRHASAHYLVNGRDIHHLVAEDDIANHAGVGNIDSKRYGNAVTIGIEQHHNQNDPWDPDTVRSTAKVVAHLLTKYPNLTLGNILGHGDVAPEHKGDEPRYFPWNDFYRQVREFMGGRDVGTGIHEGQQGRSIAGGRPAPAQQPIQQTAASQEAKVRTGVQSAAHIMREEGSSGSQDGIPEIFGFRKGQDSEYPELARLRASGDEQGVQRLAVEGLVKRAIAAGSGNFSDPAVKAQIMSLAHMRGPGGARTILNAVGGNGHLTAEGSSELDPQAIAAIQQMPREEFMRRVHLARTVYDQKFHGQEYWNRFGKSLAGRYNREHEFYRTLD